MLGGNKRGVEFIARPDSRSRAGAPLRRKKIYKKLLDCRSRYAPSQRRRNLTELDLKQLLHGWENYSTFIKKTFLSLLIILRGFMLYIIIIKGISINVFILNFIITTQGEKLCPKLHPSQLPFGIWYLPMRTWPPWPARDTALSKTEPWPYPTAPLPGPDPWRTCRDLQIKRQNRLLTVKTNGFCPGLYFCLAFWLIELWA